MLAVGFRFPAARYHATPWGRHVNEAEVEWPPAPWRILRGLIATWHHKADNTRFPQALLDNLVENLGATLPVFQLPPAVRAHSRHYMPQGKLNKGRETTSLIFDAFVRLPADAELVVGWPDVELTDDEIHLLQSLIRDMGYLGRAESWVEGRVFTDWNGTVNCRTSELSVDTETGEAFEPIRLAAPMPAPDYTAWRTQQVYTHDLSAKRLKAAQKNLLHTLPERLADAMRLETGQIQQVGWSNPPGVRFITYQRPYDAFTPERTNRIEHRSPQVTTARLALAGKPLPRIENAVKIGELIRLAAMKQAEHHELPISPALSGHNLPAENRHGHAFYLPEMDRNGHISHVLVHAADGLDYNALRALDSITRIWEKDGAQWQVLFEAAGQARDFGAIAYCQQAQTWQSVTPYLHPWFRKKRFTIEDQIRRECRERGLPQPTLTGLPTIKIKQRTRRTVHFHRFRRKRGLTQPDTQGSFWQLQFPEPITGPLALGFGCHFGLGLFRATASTD